MAKCVVSYNVPVPYAMSVSTVLYESLSYGCICKCLSKPSVLTQSIHPRQGFPKDEIKAGFPTRKKKVII